MAYSWLSQRLWLGTTTTAIVTYIAENTCAARNYCSSATAAGCLRGACLTYLDWRRSEGERGGRGGKDGVSEGESEGEKGRGRERDGEPICQPRVR